MIGHLKDWLIIGIKSLAEDNNKKDRLIDNIKRRTNKQAQNQVANQVMNQD